MTLNINHEFEKNIFPISQEEFELLEQNIIEEGIRDPIVIWSNNIIDGHNRYKIAMKHNLPFQTIEKNFDSNEDAKDWQDKNQLGRRNLTTDQRIIIIGRRYNREKNANGVRKNQLCQNGEAESTAQRIGSESGVSKRTVQRYAKKAKEFDKIKNENPVLAEGILNGKTTLKLATKQTINPVFDKDEFAKKFNAIGSHKPNRSAGKSKEEKEQEIKRMKAIKEKIEIEKELEGIARKVNMSFTKEYRIYFISLIKT